MRILRIVILFSLLWWVCGGWVTAVTAQNDHCPSPFMPVSTPLTDLGNNEYVRMDGEATGFTGGLYPDGSNTRPPEHEAAGQAIAATIVPLNEAGEPDADGRVAMISVGMSNTGSEFNTFIGLIHQHPQVNPQLTVVNGAQGGRTADRWTAAETDVWLNLDNALNRAGVTPEQVQVAWVKQTLRRGGEFPEKAEELQAHLTTIVQALKTRFPNLKIVYLSSRTRSYLYEQGLSPEPVAFETAFAVKWLIEQQINGDPTLNYDPAKGEVVAPYLSWGPYLWIDGENVRSDGRAWLAEELTRDCVHPSRSGNQKVAEMLLEFFLTDSTTGWFRVGDAPVVIAQSPMPQPSDTAAPPTPTAMATEAPSPTAIPLPTDTPTSAYTAVPLTTVPTPTLIPTPEDAAGQTAVWPMIVVAGTAVIIVGWIVYQRRV